MMKFDTQWQTQDLDHVIRWFIKDYIPEPGFEIMDVEYYIDTGRNKVVFKINLKRETRITQ